MSVQSMCGRVASERERERERGATSLILSGRLSWVRRLPQDRAELPLPASVYSITVSWLAIRLPFWFNARVWLPVFEIFNVNTEMLMHAIVHGVCTNTVTGSKLKVDWFRGEKSLVAPGNQTCHVSICGVWLLGPTLYQLSFAAALSSRSVILAVVSPWRRISEADQSHSFYLRLEKVDVPLLHVYFILH